MTTGAAPQRSWRVRTLGTLNARGFRLLYVLDAVLIYVVLWVITFAQILIRPAFNAAQFRDRYAWTYLIIVVVHLAVFYFGGLYDRPRRLGGRPIATRLVGSVWLASLVVGGISLLLDEFLVPRSVLLIYAVVGPLTLAANRWIARRIRHRAEGPVRVLLVGDAPTLRLAQEHLTQAVRDIEVVGTADSVDQIEDLVTRVGATDVALLDTTSLEPLYHASLAGLERLGVSVIQIVRPQDSLLGLTNVGEIGGMPFVALSTHALSPSQARLKRWMDLAVLVLTAPLTIPLTLVTAAYVRVVAGRPVLFVQARIGRDGAPFAMLKFRSMTVGAEAGSGPVAAAVDDVRIVRGMGWVRATRLDELPQLVNVLTGRMTVVGPRPVRPEELESYDRRYPGYHRRHQTPPGITGLAQVYGHYHTAIEYKLGHDLHYLANWSPLLDLQIMLRTAWVILTRRL